MLFNELYYGNVFPRELDKLPEYKPPETFSHGNWVLVATLKSKPNDDGMDVEIHEIRLPARFYKIVALDTTNSVNEINKGFSLSTGSGQENLVIMIARAIQEGMIGLSD